MEGLLSKNLDHNEIYDAKYYHRLDAAVRGSAMIMADSIIEELDPETVIDVGCGAGALLQALGSRGIRGLGLDFSEAALEICRSRGLDVRRFDLINDSSGELGYFDLVVSTEVAEHLPSEVAGRYVDLLCRLGRAILITAATPGQGGTSHVNEQCHEYWIGKLDKRTFELAENLSERLRASWQAQGVVPYYHRNVMVFRRRVDES